MRTKLIAYFLVLASSVGLAQIYTPGSGGTSSGGGGGLTNGYSFDAAFFRTANTTNIFAKDGANVTNLNVQTSVKVAGNQTNTGGGWLVMEDGALTTIMLYGDSGGPAILSSNANIDFGIIGKSVSFDNNGAGRVGYASQPYGSLGYGSASAYTGGFDIVAGSNFVAANTMALKGLTASRAVFLNSSGQLTNVTSGSPSTEYVKADGTTGTPSGSGTPAGNSGAIQFNEGGAFAGTNYFVFDRTNNAFGLGIPQRPEATLQLSNSSQAALFVDGQSGGLGRMGIRPFAIGTEASAVIPTYSLMYQGTNILTMGHKSLLSRAIIQTPAVSNHTVSLGSSGTMTIYGTNSHYTADITGTSTFADSGLVSGILYNIRLTNDASTVNWPGPWRWTTSPTLTTGPSAQGGTYRIGVWLDGNGTNAAVMSAPSFDLAAGWGQALVTNTTTKVVSIVSTNREASIATNATSVTLDFGDTANINRLNGWFHLTTNLVVSPTNLVVGRTMAVYFDTNSLTYDVTFTNTAATPVRWNFNVSTNGSTSFTKTNTMRARVFLTAETNGVITAEMGYYR